MSSERREPKETLLCPLRICWRKALLLLGAEEAVFNTGIVASSRSLDSGLTFALS